MSTEAWKVSDFDECYCGDYRKDHAGGSGACVFNHMPGGPHAGKKCFSFRLTRAATEIPKPYAKEPLNEHRS